ncbi:heme-binding protein [Tundrisphaera lichenicola]|uniref:heme-binding protein n=1 Tax=Tundrisphaera lichenicola TaxID=2029860 RepID=UPI003EBBF226
MRPMLKPLACVILLSIGAAPGLARGQGPNYVIDGAGMFGKESVNQATQELSGIARDQDVIVTIETVESLGGEGIDEFAKRKAQQLGHQGLYVLISKKDRKIDVLASPRALREELGIPRLNSIRDTFSKEFGKGRPDAGLTEGVQAAKEALALIRPARRPQTTLEAVGITGTNSPLILRQQVRLTLAGARKAIAGAEAHAIEKGYKMNIAAVDDGGHLLAFARMDGARPASVNTSMTKAVTAATFRQASGTLPTGAKDPDVLLNLSVQNASGGRITTLQGGVPIIVDGQVIGAVGVGGGSGEQDAEVARAGVEAFLAGLSNESKVEVKEGTPQPAATDNTPPR